MKRWNAPSSTAGAAGLVTAVLENAWPGLTAHGSDRTFHGGRPDDEALERSPGRSFRYPPARL